MEYLKKRRAADALRAHSQRQSQNITSGIPSIATERAVSYRTAWRNCKRHQIPARQRGEMAGTRSCSDSPPLLTRSKPARPDPGRTDWRPVVESSRRKIGKVRVELRCSTVPSNNVPDNHFKGIKGTSSESPGGFQ